MPPMLLRRPVFALLLAALAVAGAWHAWRRIHAIDPVAELARLVPGHRPLLARTSLPGPHAPFDPEAPSVGPAGREAIYARLLAAKVQGVPGGAAALAAFYAARAEPGDAERALSEAADPVDRGAVLLHLDRADEALEAFAKALAARPADSAALFGRALALEALLLEGQAREGWNALLAIEAGGPWADEARRRVALIGRREELAPPLDGRKHEAWKDLQERTGPGGLERWDGLAAELAAGGDRLVLAELAYLRGLDGAGWRQRAERVRRYREATEAVFAGRDAGRDLATLEADPEPQLSVKATHFAAYSAIVRSDRRAAEAVLERLRERCRVIGCVEELVLVESDLGTLLEAAGDPEGAAAAYEAARQDLPAAFGQRHAEILAKQANLAVSVGADAEAAHQADRAVALERAHGSLDTLDTTLRIRASASRELGRDATAEAFLREALAVARENPDRVHAARAELALSDLLADLGRRPEATLVIEGTVRWLRDTELDSTLGWALAELARHRLAAGEIGLAREASQEAVRLADESGMARRQVRAREVRASVGRADRDPRAEEEALRQAVRLDEGIAARAPGALARYRSQHAASGRRFALARVVGERGAALEAFEIFQGGSPPPLLEGECRIGLARVDDQLLAFSLSAAGARFESRPVPTSKGVDGALPEATIGTPWGSNRCPDAASRIAVVQRPGAIGVPLARNAGRARPGTVIGIARGPGSPWPGPPRRRSALVVHSPATDPEAGQPLLPGGASEAATLAATFHSVDALTGPAATPAALASAADRHDLLHLSTHGVSRSGRGPASWLLLAGEGRQGRLPVSDVLEFDLRARRPLVVLSSCRTAAAPVALEYDGGGLPWAFLEAGASAVVATTEAIADDVAVAFAERFSAALRDGSPPAEAVASAVESVASGPRRGADSGYLLFF